MSRLTWSSTVDGLPGVKEGKVSMESLGHSPDGDGLNVEIVDDLNFLKHVMFEHFQNIAL